MGTKNHVHEFCWRCARFFFGNTFDGCNPIIPTPVTHFFAYHDLPQQLLIPDPFARRQKLVGMQPLPQIKHIEKIGDRMEQTGAVVRNIAQIEAWRRNFVRLGRVSLRERVWWDQNFPEILTENMVRLAREDLARTTFPSDFTSENMRSGVEILCGRGGWPPVCRSGWMRIFLQFRPRIWCVKWKIHTIGGSLAL